MYLLQSQEYIFTNMVLRIGERLRLLGSTPVEQAAARQWIQYRITRLGITDKREFEEALQVRVTCYPHHRYHGNTGIRLCSQGQCIFSRNRIWHIRFVTLL